MQETAELRSLRNDARENASRSLVFFALRVLGLRNSERRLQQLEAGAEPKARWEQELLASWNELRGGVVPASLPPAARYFLRCVA